VTLPTSRAVLRAAILASAGPLVGWATQPGSYARGQSDGQVVAEPASNGQPPASPDATISAILARVLDKYELPGGMVAGIVDRDRLRAVGAAGTRKIASNQRMTIHDQVHIGSCTKAMTATMVATLVQDGRMAWESTLGDLLPDVAMHASYRPATLRQLLSHRAGLPRNAAGMLGPDVAALFFMDSRTDRQKRRDLVASALEDPPQFPPGTGFEYSNLGYVVAGHVAERVADRPWQELMRRRLFRPLGMKSAGFGPPGEPGELDQPWGHMKLPVLGWTALQQDNPSAIGPAGTVHCTLADWARFASLHLGAAPTGKPRLRPQTLEILHAPVGPAGQQTQRYALGWGVADREWAQGAALAHEGSNTMWHATIWLAPKIHTAFLAVANSGGASEACDAAIGELIKYAGRSGP
jgi:CubicO group peptidase (beta-lactamase class C family)